MNCLRLGAAALNQTPLDWKGNRDRIAQAIASARRQSVSILCLPELCVTGYGCEDAFHAPNTQRKAWESLSALVPMTEGMIVSIGLPILHRKGLFNCAALVVDGRVAGFAAKRFLAGDGIHYEPRWFKAWPAGVRATVETADAFGMGPRLPIGDLVFDCGGVRIGYEICEDAWVADRPGVGLARKAVDVILNPSASHFAFGKVETRKRLVVEGSRAFGAAYVYSNLVGNESGRAIFDGGALVAADGRLLAAGPRFGFHDAHVTAATVDIESVRASQARSVSFDPELAGDEPGLVRAPFVFPDTPFSQPTAVLPGWEKGERVKFEEFARAEALGLWDYLRKSRSQGFVVSLSGGADSAAAACLVRIMCELALQELGAGEVEKRLPANPGAPVPGDPAALVRRLLATVYQACENSGAACRRAAGEVAQALGAEHFEFDVGGIARAYVDLVERATGARLNWVSDDVALQNIQARTRSPGAWLLANLRNAILLATSNRSEAAVGYATMDGDTSGGLSPLAGIDKAWLRQWLRWMETEGPLGIGPIPELAGVNAQAPTAELRPPEQGQTDEEDLMPYPILDEIERAAIRDKRPPLEVLVLLRDMHGDIPTARLGLWVERFFRLWCRNQWKRERYAPSFHLDDENLDPKTWCRFPILSGGFEAELAEMREFIQRAS